MPKKRAKKSRLKLSHHSHTGKRLHHSHTSYPLVAFLLLIVGVFLAFSTVQTHAAATGSGSVTVTAKSNGPPPLYAARILDPQNGDRFNAPGITVTGTCAPRYFVKLFKNDIFAGAAPCTDDGTFRIAISLFVGRNDLEARTYNVIEKEGPRSNIVDVYFGNPGDLGNLFYISTDYFYRAAYSGQKIKWDFKAMGGTAPYKATIIWGDGYSDTQTVTGTDFSFEHTYETLKSQRQYFTVMVILDDYNGYQTSLQLVSIMNDPDIIGGALLGPYDNQPPNWLTYIWSVYGLLVLMGLCFWLGERRGELVTSQWYRRRRQRA